MDPGIAALLGAALGSLSGVAGQFLIARSARTRGMADRALQTYVEYLSSTHHASLVIGAVARAEPDLTTKVEAVVRHLDPLLDRVNSALEAVLLVGEADVRAAAARLDEELIDLDELSRSRQFTREEWRVLRDSRVNPLLEDFRSAANTELKKLGRSL